MEDKTYIIIKILLLLCFVITICLTERLYNKPLFQYSLDFIINLQNSTPSFLMMFLRIVTYSCYLEVIFPLIIIIFNFCSLQSTFLLFNVLFVSTLVTNLMKLIYADPRPFWVKTNISVFKCEIDYGNPSGHAVCAFSFYMTLFQFIYDKYLNNKQLLYKISYWITVLSFLLLILISRLAVGVHSINQVFYGTLVGFAIYVIYYFLLDIHLYKSEEFLGKFQQGNYYTLWYILTYLAGVVNAVMVFYIQIYDNRKWEANLKKMCPKISEIMKFQNFDLGLTIVIFACIGMISGIFILMGILNLRSPGSDLVRLQALNNWSETKFIYKVYRVILTVIFFAFIVLPINLIKAQIVNFLLRICLTIGLMIFILFLLMFSLLIYIFIKLGIANEDLTSEKDHNFSEEVNQLVNKDETGKENINLTNEEKK